MITADTLRAMPQLPRPDQKVRWRDPEQARACGWEAVFGAGPFAVVRTVDHSDHGLAKGLVLRTALGEQEINEVWLALADPPEGAAGSGGAAAAEPLGAGLTVPQGRQ
jgi:hypothetical protein